jgi:cytochrome c-type biogenesis protein
LGPAVLPAAFLFGLLGAATSCCTVPVIGAVTGYAGSLGGQRDRRSLLLVAVFFMVGTILALAALGAVTGLLGRLAGAALGRYWRASAGLVMVLFGLAAMRLVPFSVPKFAIAKRSSGRGAAGAMVFGLAVGGATTACTLGCNPLLPVAVGTALLKGSPLLGAAILASFAIGYSLPLVAALVGIGLGLGWLSRVTQRALPALQIGVGVLMAGIGFYLLAGA